MDKDIEKILYNTFKTSGWIIQKPPYGLSKETYVAQNGPKRVFIKFEVNIPPLKRVSDLGLAPCLLSSGTYHNRTYVIQQFVKGIIPTRKWINNNLKKLAELIKSYHSDKELFYILKNNSKLDYKNNVNDSLKFVEKQLEEVKQIIITNKNIENGIKKLMNESKNLRPVPLTVIHTDPNYKNMLLVGNRLYILDWDDVRISDPVRDIAPLLWWYIDKNKWPMFFNYLGIEMIDSLMNRFYWWMARQSLTIAIFFAKKNDVKKVNKYLVDFAAALNHSDNPRLPTSDI